MADLHCERTASSDVNQLAVISCEFDNLLGAKLLSETCSNTPEQRSLQPEADALVDLTQQIQRLQLGANSSLSSETTATASESTTKETKSDTAKQQAAEQNQQLTALYCQRAESILRYVDYDASAQLSATLFSAAPSVQDTESDEPEQQDEGDSSNSRALFHDGDSAPVSTLCGVEKALDDAVTAIALAPDCVDALILAAQSARALGNTTHAVEFIGLARQRTGADVTPRIDQLERELAVDAQTLPLDSLAPPLKTTLELLAVFDTPNQDEQQQQQGDDSEDESEEPEDRGDISDERERFYETLCTGVRTLHAIVVAPWLANLETMMHENVHHQCASRDDVHALEAAFDTTAAFLGALLAHDLTVVALGLTDHVSNVQELLAAVTATLRATGGARRQQLVENRSVRKWLAQTLAPAVRRFPTQIGRMSLSALEAAVANSTGTSQSHQEAVLAMLMRDALLVLTRVLLAMASWRRCTTMPHALLYAELCADLAKEIGACDGTFSGLSRFELMCSDVYARGLLELTPEHSDALQLHQESLQTALTTKDRSYVLRCHHHVGQAFLRMGELELAQSEFTEILNLSRALGESRIESLAQYELGECCVQRGNLPQAHTHFKHAQTLCNQTANAGGTWRAQSVQQAIAFYTAMKPARRGAIRIATAKTRPRRGSFVRTASLLQQVAPASDALSSSDDESLADAPKLRRPAIWIGPPKLQAKTERDSKRSLVQTLLGEQTDPLIVDESPDASNEKNQSTPAVTTTVAEKLFRTATAAAVDRPQTPKRSAAKPRRAGAWRDSVFAVPPSYNELRSLAAAARSP